MSKRNIISIMYIILQSINHYSLEVKKKNEKKNESKKLDLHFRNILHFNKRDSSHVHKHVWTFFLTLHILHLTSQHHWKVQPHLSTTIISWVLYPRLQHIKSHPSNPMDVSLHTLPVVPRIPSRGFFSQKGGEGSMYTKSMEPGGLCSGLWGSKCDLYRFRFLLDKPLPASLSEFVTRMREAPSNLSLRLSPTILKLGKRIQHVLVVHEPDIPWHLHSWRISDATCCNKSKKRKTLKNKLKSFCNMFINCLIPQILFHIMTPNFTDCSKQRAMYCIPYYVVHLLQQEKLY